MDYEVLNVGSSTVMPNWVNPLCPSSNGICPGANLFCPGTNASCPGIDASCGVDSNCANSYPCENPGFGCRSGCGGAKGTNCATPYSI